MFSKTLIKIWRLATVFDVGSSAAINVHDNFEWYAVTNVPVSYRLLFLLKSFYLDYPESEVGIGL